MHSINLSRAIQDHGHGDVTYLSGFNEIIDHLCAVTRPGDVVMTLGAGNVWKIGEDLLKRLKGA